MFQGGCHFRWGGITGSIPGSVSLSAFGYNNRHHGDPEQSRLWFYGIGSDGFRLFKDVFFLKVVFQFGQNIRVVLFGFGTPGARLFTIFLGTELGMGGHLMP